MLADEMGSLWAWLLSFDDVGFGGCVVGRRAASVTAMHRYNVEMSLDDVGHNAAALGI